MTCSQQSENDSRMSVGNMLICFEQFNKKKELRCKYQKLILKNNDRSTTSFMIYFEHFQGFVQRFGHCT